MLDLAEFLASLPPHLKPSNETERLLMTYAWYAGHNAGIKDGLAKLNEALLRAVPVTHWVPLSEPPKGNQMTKEIAEDESTQQGVD